MLLIGLSYTNLTLTYIEDDCLVVRWFIALSETGDCNFTPLEANPQLKTSTHCASRWARIHSRRVATEIFIKHVIPATFRCARQPAPAIPTRHCQRGLMDGVISGAGLTPLPAPPPPPPTDVRVLPSYVIDDRSICAWRSSPEAIYIWNATKSRFCSWLRQNLVETKSLLTLNFFLGTFDSWVGVQSGGN